MVRKDGSRFWAGGFSSARRSDRGELFGFVKILCRRLRRHGPEGVVIAALSGYGRPEDLRQSQEAGFDRHLVKPIGRAALEELVKTAAGRE